jgi:hypothetical protein
MSAQDCMGPQWFHFEPMSGAVPAKDKAYCSGCGGYQPIVGGSNLCKGCRSNWDVQNAHHSQHTREVTPRNWI